jgi:hypothetical protein
MHLCRINSCAPGWKGLPMPKYIASRAPARNRTSELPDGLSRSLLALRKPLSRAVAAPDLLCPNFQLNDRTTSARIARCHEHAGARYSAAVAALEGPPERLHVRDAASVTTSVGMGACHVG